MAESDPVSESVRDLAAALVEACCICEDEPASERPCPACRAAAVLLRLPSAKPDAWIAVTRDAEGWKALDVVTFDPEAARSAGLAILLRLGMPNPVRARPIWFHAEGGDVDRVRMAYEEVVERYGDVMQDLARSEAEECDACFRCLEGRTDEAGWPITGTRMIACQRCGHKRCPKAHDHRNSCSGSNALGQ